MVKTNDITVVVLLTIIERKIKKIVLVQHQVKTIIHQRITNIQDQAKMPIITIIIVLIIIHPTKPTAFLLLRRLTEKSI